jgi:hypothetical protein
MHMAQGCVRAVNLRHLSKPEEAEADFSAAYELADRIADGQAIAAYILNDWASMHEASKGIEMVEAAIRKLETEGVTTPDLERFVPADLAYFEATLARMHAQTGIPGAAKHMTDARRSFRVRMQGLPRYEGAFLVILGWECQMNLRNPTRLISPAARFLVTALRQGKQRELLKLLLEPAYCAGILGRR